MTGTRNKQQNLPPILPVDDEEFGVAYELKSKSSRSPLKLFASNKVKPKKVHIFLNPPDPKLENDPFDKDSQNFIEKYSNVILKDLDPTTAKIILRAVRGRPDIYEVIEYEKVDSKIKDMPETEKEIQIISKGYVFRNKIVGTPLETFKLSEKKVFPDKKNNEEEDRKQLIDDVKQNTFGDCFLLSAILGILGTPEGAKYIRNMIKVYGDFAVVRLYDPRINDFVFIRIKNTEFHENDKSVVKHKHAWVHILEKAYTALAYKEVTTSIGQNVKKTGELTFQDMYGAGGKPRVAMTILTGKLSESEEFEKPKFDYPWDEKSIRIAFTYYQEVGVLFNGFSKREKGFEEIAELENSIEKLLVEDPDLLNNLSQQFQGDSQNFPNLPEISQNTHVAKIHSILSLFQNESNFPTYLRQVSNFIALKRLSVMLLQMGGASESISANFSRLHLILEFGSIINKRLEQKPFLRFYQEKIKGDTKIPLDAVVKDFKDLGSPEGIEELPEFLDKMLRQDGSVVSEALKAEFKRSYQRINYEPANTPINNSVANYPWNKDSYDYCKKFYLLQHAWLADRCNLNELKSLDDLFEHISLDFSNIKTQEQLLKIIHEKQLDNRNGVKIPATALIKKLFQAEANTQTVLNQLSLYHNSYQKVKNANQQPILHITKNLSDLVMIGKVVAHASEKDKANIEINTELTGTDFYTYLYQLKKFKTSNGEGIPRHIIDRFNKYGNKLFYATKNSESKSSGVYSADALQFYQKIKLHGADGIPMTSSTLSSFDTLNKIDGLFPKHAYAILDAKEIPYEGQSLKYIVLRNPWGHVGVTDQYESKDATKGKSSRTNEGTFNIELSEFHKYFGEVTFGSPLTVTPMPEFSKDMIENAGKEKPKENLEQKLEQVLKQMLAMLNKMNQELKHLTDCLSLKEGISSEKEAVKEVPQPTRAHKPS